MQEHNSGLKMACGAFLCAALSNIELLYLKNDEIASLYHSVLCDIDYFLEKKQFFIVINVLFALSLSSYFCSGELNRHYTVYTFNRIRSKSAFFAKRLLILTGKQAIFSLIYCITTMGLCSISCGKGFDRTCWFLLLTSTAAILYAGTFFAVFCSVTALFIDERIAVLFVMLFMILLSFASMAGIDWLGTHRIFLIINPITAVTVTEESTFFKLAADCGLILLVLFIEMAAAVKICKKKGAA